MDGDVVLQLQADGIFFATYEWDNDWLVDFLYVARRNENRKENLNCAGFPLHGGVGEFTD